MRALSRFCLASLALALSLASVSAAVAQDCPNCHPHHFHHGLLGHHHGGHWGHDGYCADGHCGHGHFGHGRHFYKTGEYDRYGGFDAHGYYSRGIHGPYSGPGNCQYRDYGSPDLFRQYYVGNNCGGVPAGLYPAPNNLIPPHVGHVYYTYQPLQPHEFLYPHHRTYHRYYDDGRGLTRVKVRWMW